MKCRRKKPEPPVAELPKRLQSVANETLATAVAPKGVERKWEVMPFGRYRGEPIEDLPTDYLLWAVENLERRDNGLYETLEAELWGRSDLR